MSAVLESVFKDNAHYKLSKQEECRKRIYAKQSKGLLATLRYWKAISYQRKQLAKLDERMLDDIGLSRAQVKVELDKPFWR